jgi:ribosome-associated translation inhibitor RaiA
MRVSLAKVIEKLEKQMRRYIEKTKTVYTKPDHAMKEKIWTSAELVEENEAEEYIEDVIDEK